MQLTLSPLRGLPGQAETRLSVEGDTLTVDDVAYDFSAVPDGGCLKPDAGAHPFIGDVLRIDGELRITLHVVLGETAAPTQVTDKAHWNVTLTAGSLSLPVTRKEEPSA